MAQQPRVPKASALAAGADRARGERARRRATPLLAASQPSEEVAASTPRPSRTPSAASKHRPLPVVSSVPAERVLSLTGERRVPRSSPRAKRAADAETARRLRLAPPPVPAARARRESASAAQPAPAALSGSAQAQPGARPMVATSRTPGAGAPASPFDVPAADDGAGLPGLPDLLTGGISALRILLAASGITAEDIERRIAGALAYLRRRIEGDYEVDEFGYDPHFTENVVLPILRPIATKWFRIEVRGLENIPDEGAALLVANHSGTIAIDSIMLQVMVHDQHRRHRMMRALGADLVFQSPFLGTFARRSGSTLAANADADRLLAKGELVGVFPEGFKGVGKPFSERYKLQRFGRGGFVSAALKAKAPIIPVSIVGAEEIAPIIGNMSTIARILGVPYAPITPTFPWLGPLGLIPLPSKWIIEIGTPIPTDQFGERAEDDPMLVFDLTDQIRETIQQTLYSLLLQRRSVFF